ncbi:alpha/beta fold hydrolase, partial [Aquabacterium sp. UBA2148]|uniref:alpha/beta hydrolase family protein n=1 Tax=Aquabacterium sp. UBA2148 TaxID=1946042 RepID=UPI00257C9666
MSATVDTFVLRAGDGHGLAARAYVPAGEVRRAVLIGAAMGVPQRFYQAFATWLAEQGVAVLTFDWRGTGDSAPRSLRGFKASITDWAMQDLPAAADALCARWPDAPRTFLGHSLGGQLFGWLAQPERFERVLTVASGNGYWRMNAPAVRRKAPLLWWVLAPVGIALAGYFPGKRLGAVGDLPAAAMWQWRRWCLHPDYVGSEGPALREP